MDNLIQRYFLAKESINSVLDHIKNIPLVLRILCGASLVLSPLLLTSIFIPELSLAITKTELTSWLPNAINSFLFGLIGIGILLRWKLTTIAIIITPLVQDASMYLWSESNTAINILELASSFAIWAIASAVYLKFFGGWNYFTSDKK